MRVLITGATGFVGMALLRALANDHEVTALHSGRNALRPDVAPLANWIAMDLGRGLDPDDLPASIDAVVHLAVSPYHRNFPASALDLFNVNTRSTAELLDYAVHAGCEHFICASSGSVYGDPAGVITETTVVSPTAYFASAKAAADLLALGYQDHMTVCVPRIFFPYGPDQHDRLVPNLANRIVSGEPVQLAGSDGFSCQLLFIDDLVASIVQSLSDRWSGVVNIAGTQLASLRDIASWIGEAVGVEPKFTNDTDALGTVFDVDLTRLGSMVDLDNFMSPKLGLQRSLATENEPS